MIYNTKLSSHSQQLSRVLHIYESSFPIDERRDIDTFLSLIEKEEAFSVEAICCDDKVVGFIAWWRLGEWRFVEHLAIDESMRGCGIGHEVLQRFLKENNLPVVLEVEPPTDINSCRRIAFYRSLGFVLHDDYDYIQPSYCVGRKPVKLRLMSYGVRDKLDCKSVEVELHRVVYGIV